MAGILLSYKMLIGPQCHVSRYPGSSLSLSVISADAIERLIIVNEKVILLLFWDKLYCTNCSATALSQIKITIHEIYISDGVREGLEKRLAANVYK